MAWIDMSHYADTLQMNVRVNVLVPQPDYWKMDAAPYPVLWLLHGACGNSDDWLRFTAVERYAMEKGLMVVMPSAQNSSYLDMRRGGGYYTYIGQELYEKIGRFFPASRRREENFLCGYSMGGFGAMVLGMSRAGQYGAIGCLSAGIDFVERILPDSLILDGQCPLYADVRANARAVAAGDKPKVRVYLAMGTEDPLLPYARDAQAFFDGFQKETFDFTYTETKGGHDWAFWDGQLKAYLNWLKLPDRAGE